jgi:hypothetical protein
MKLEEYEKRWTKNNTGCVSHHSVEDRLRKINPSKATAVELIKYLTHEPNSDFYMGAVIEPIMKDDVTFAEMRNALLNWVIRMAEVASMEYELRQESTSEDRKLEILEFLTYVKLWWKEDDSYHACHSSSDFGLEFHNVKISA